MSENRSNSASEPLKLRKALVLAWSLRSIFLPNVPAALAVLLLAVLQADLLVGVTSLTQQLLDSFSPGADPAALSRSAGAEPFFSYWISRLSTSGGRTGIIIGLIATAVVAELISLANSEFRFRISQNFRGRLRRMVIARMLTVSGGDRARCDTATSQMIFSNDCGALGMFLIFGLLGFLEQLVKLAILTAGLCQFADGAGWKLAVILVPAAVIFKAVVMRLFFRWESRANHESSTAMMQARRKALEFFPMIARLVYLKGEKAESEQLLVTARRASMANQRFQMITNLHASTSQLITILALPLAALLMLGMAASPGTVAQSQGLFLCIIGIAGGVISFPSQIIQYSPALRRVTDLLGLPDAGDAPRELNIARAAGAETLKVEDLHFSYDPGTLPVIRGINLDIPKGSLVAVVGASGSGKSTLARLLIGELQPDRGRILHGNLDLTDWPLWWRREVIAFLPAEVGFLAGTLRENIRFGRPEVEDEAIKSSALQCGLAKALERYGDEPCTNPDTQFSTGEQRRIGVARILVGTQGVWILDEPLANMDRDNMRTVAGAIRKACEGRTTLVITHDPGDIEADMIVFLADGKVAQIGAHEDLLASNEAYRKLYGESPDESIKDPQR